MLHVEPISIAAAPIDLVAVLGPHGFLLESSVARGNLGRFSFLGRADGPTLLSRGSHCRIVEPDGTARSFESDPFEAAAELWQGYRIDPTETAGLPFPFRAGLVGWFGYELGRVLERLPGRARLDLDLPDLALAPAARRQNWDAP